MAKKKKKNQLDLDIAFEKATYTDYDKRKEYYKEKVKEKKKQDQWVDFSAFEDGYDFLDVSKSILGTGTKVQQKFTKGVQSNLEGFLDTGTNWLSMGTEALGWDKATKGLRKFAQKDFIEDADLVNKTLRVANPVLNLYAMGASAKENLSDGFDATDIGKTILQGSMPGSYLEDAITGEKSAGSKAIDKLADYSVTGNKLDELTQTVGQITGQAVLTGVGVPWQLTAFANSAGNEMNNAFQNNATAGQAFLSGLISGAVEVGTEYIGSGANKLFGMESLGSKALGKLGSKISNKAIQYITKIGFDGASEGLEEVLSGLGTAIGQKLTYMNDKDLNELYSSDQALDDFVMGALGSIVTNVPNSVRSVSRGENAFTGLTENEKTVLDKEIERRTNDLQKNGKELTKGQKKQLEESVQRDLQKGYISADFIEETLGKDFDRSKDNYLQESFRERIRSNFRANIDTSNVKNEFEKATLESANRFLDGTNKARETAEIIAKLSKDTNTAIEFTNNNSEEIQSELAKIKDKAINKLTNKGMSLEEAKAKVDNRFKNATLNGMKISGENGNKILINADSPNMLAAITGHEITHLLENTNEYKKLRKLAYDYAKLQGDERSADVEDYGLYEEISDGDSEYLNQELTADLVGDYIVNNEDFIRNLYAKDKNVFQKIKDFIDDLVTRFTGTDEERKLRECQRSFERAIREYNKGQKNINIETTQQETQQKTENIQQQTTEDIAPIKEQVKETPKEFAEVTDEDLFNINMEEVENQFDKQEYKLNEDADDTTPFGNYWDLDDNYFKLKDGNTLWIETPREYGKYKNGKTNYQQEIYNKIDFMIEDSNGEIIDEYSIENEKGEFTRDDILNAIKHMTYDDSNKVADGQLDIFDNVHKNDGHRYSLSQDNQGDESEKIILADGRTYNNYYEFAKDISKNKEDLVKELLFKHYSQNFDVPANTNETKFYHGTDATFDYDGLKVMDFDEQTMDRNYGDYFYITTDKGFSHTYGSQIAEFIIPNDKILSLEDYRQNYSDKTNDELFEKYWALEMPDKEYIVKDIKPIIDYSKQRANDYINQQESKTKYSLTDNQGRQLSEQQQEYFKDSKVRDNEGRLLEVYHGTPSQDNFAVFDPNRAGENTLSGEYGLYFTDSKEFADDFSYERLESDSMFFDIKGEKGNVYTNYLNVTNPLDFAKLTKEDISNLYDYASDLGKLDGKERFVENMLKWQQIGNHQLMKGNLDLKAIADNSNYDGIKAKLNVQGNENEYIVFNSNQVKNIDNTNPTSNPDIRYSLSVSEANTGKDNEGRELSEQQKEYFKDSKITDENGNLIPLYHGSNSEFTIFDLSKSGESSKEAKIGFWFTPNKKGAENFANEAWYGDKTPTTYEVYLNIKNPKIYETYEVDQQQRDNMLQNMKNLEQEIRDSSHKYSWTETGDYKITSLYNDLVEMNRREINGIKFKEDAQYNEDFYRKLAEERNISTEKFNEMNQDAKNQVELETQNRKARDDYHSYIFSDAYEQFRTELYLSAGMSAEDANVGGMGMMIKNENEAVENFVNGLKQEGYDGIIIKNTHYDNESLGEGKNNDQYVAFYSNQIKNIDNQNPTSDNDIRYSLSKAPRQDNKGRELSEQQQEFFKDAVTKNENGELQVYYNGGGDYTLFDNTKMSDQSKWGKGIYLTKDNNIASSYGENVKEVYANITNPLSQTEKTISFEQYNELSKALYDEEAYREEYDMFDNDLDLLWDITNKGNWADYANEIKQYTGKDGLIIEDEDIREDMAIAFQSNQIKNIDNLNPTEDPDIRKSLSRQNDIAPIGGWNVRGSDIAFDENKIKNALTPVLAPIKESVDQLNQSLQELKQQNNLDDLTLDITPFLDMINGTEETNQLSPQNLEKAKETLVQQGVPTDAAQNFVQNMVNRFDTQFNKIRDKFNEKDRNKFQKMILDAQEKFTNRNAYVDKLAKDSGNEMIKYKGDLANNSFGQAQYNVQTAQTDLNGNEIGKAVNGLFEQAEKQGLGAVLDDYLFHKSNIERHAVGKGSQVPASVSEQLIMEYEKSYPQLKEWSKGFETYYDNLLQLEVDSGLIDQDTYNLLRGEKGIYRSYMPFFENEAEKRYYDDAGDLKPIKPLKRAKGGANQSKLMGMKQAMTKQTMAVWQSMRTNQLYQEIINTLGGEEGLGFIVRNDPSNLSQSLYTDQEGNKFLTAYVNGQEMSTKISDELYNELSKKSENAIKEFEDKYSLLTKPLQGLSKFRRNVLTSYNPIFALYKNPIKDIQDAVLYSKHTAQMLKGLLPSYYQLLRNNTKEAKQFRALYGSGEFTGFGKRYARFSDMIELAPRFAEFKASLKAGESVEQALYNARDITTNFGRGGYVTKALNRNGATFLNASVQGFSKFYRNFAEQPNAGQFAMAVGKAAMLGVVPAIFNELAFGGGDDKDEEYEALPDYIKDNYYLFKKRNGDFIRVPKGRALSVMGSAARRTIERIEGEEDAFDGYLKNAWSQIGPVEIGGNPLDNTIVAPIAQAWNPLGEKKSGGNTPGRAWYGGDIVPYRLQGERPEDQSDASVDKMSIWLGEKFGISPYKINYVIDQYTGGLGDVILPMMTEETNSGAETIGEHIIAPVKDQVVVNSIDDNKYASEFYSTKGKLYTGSKATDKDLLKAQYMDDVSFDLSALYKEKREIQANEKLDKKTKYAKVQQIQKQINEIAKEGLDKYEDITLTDNYASVGDDRAYYKNTKGKWTAIKADELNTIETLGLTDSEKSAYFDVKNKIYNLDNDYRTKKEGKSESEQIKLGIQQKKDRIETIKSSTLPDSAKYAMFDTKYDDKLLPYYEDLGFKANDIMTYKSQTFAADKDKYGDSISGSKKTKVLDYINSMNIPYEQKLILWKKEYKTDNTYDRQIVSYIDSHISDYSSKKAVLEELGYEVNGNDIISANIAKKIRKKNNKK